MKANERGFTVVQLTVVVAVLAVLAAFALPRFVELRAKARQAKLQDAVRAVRAGAALFHSRCLASGCPGAGRVILEIGGRQVTGINQYPTADAGGIVAVAGLRAGPEGDYLLVGGSADSGGDALVIRVPAASANCQFSYQVPSSGEPLIVLPADDIPRSCN